MSPDKASTVTLAAVLLYEGFHATETARRVANPFYETDSFTRAEAVAEAIAFYDEASRQVKAAYATKSTDLPGHG